MEQRIKIQKIEFTEESTEMYDLSVEDNENFILQSGIVTHNSAKMIACESKRPMVYIMGNMGRDKIIDMLQRLKPNAIVLVDEIHALREPVAEVIYPAIEYGEIYVEGQLIKIPDVLFIGTTTEPEKLPKPLLARLMRIEFEEPPKELVEAILSKKDYPSELVEPLLKYTTNIRVVNKLIQYMKLYGGYTKENLLKVFKMMKINMETGLSQDQQIYLDYLHKVGKASLNTLCLVLRRGQRYVKEEIEEELVKKDLIVFSSRGRELVKHN